VNPVFDNLRRWARLRRGWIALVLLAALGAKLVPVAVASPALAAVGCAEADAHAAHTGLNAEPGALPARDAGSCCPDGAHLCAAHCTPLILISLDLPLASPAPPALVARSAGEPTPIVHPPLLRPPRA